MRALHLAIQSWCSRFDIGVAYASILQVPVEFGLELVTIVGANSIDAEREFSDDIIHEVDGILLRVPFINLQGANTGGIIDCRVLEIPDLAAFLSLEIEEFHIDLHVVPRHLFLITDGRNRPFALPIRQAIEKNSSIYQNCLPKSFGS